MLKKIIKSFSQTRTNVKESPSYSGGGQISNSAMDAQAPSKEASDWAKLYENSPLVQSIVEVQVLELLLASELPTDIASQVYVALIDYYVFNKYSLLLLTDKGFNEDLSTPLNSPVTSVLYIPHDKLSEQESDTESKQYEVSLEVAGNKPEDLIIDESRIILVESDALSYVGRVGNACRSYEISQFALARMLVTQDRLVFSIEDFQSKVVGGNRGVVDRYLNAIAEYSNIFNLTVKDTKDTLEGSSLNFSASSVILDKQVEYLCMVTGVPRYKLLGESAGGLQNSDNVQLLAYQTRLNAIKKRLIDPVVEVLGVGVEVEQEQIPVKKDTIN